MNTHHLSRLFLGPLLVATMTFSSCAAQQAALGTADSGAVVSPEVSQSYSTITDKYTDDSGYVPSDKISACVDELYRSTDNWISKGVISYREKWDSYVYIKDQSGHSIFLQAPVNGISASGNSVKLTTYQPFHDSFANEKTSGGAGITFNTGWLKAMEQIDSIPDYFAKAFGSQAVQPAYADKNVTVEAAKTFSSDSVILWDGHGVYTDDLGSCLLLSVDVPESVIKNDLDNRYIGISLLGDKKFPVLTPAFFDYYYDDGALDNSLVFLGACYSMKDRLTGKFRDDNTLSGVLEKKGAKAVYGSNESINTGYIHKMENAVLTSLANGKTAQEALTIAKQRHGKDDYTLGYSAWKKFFENKKVASILLKGDESFTLTEAQTFTRERSKFTQPTQPLHFDANEKSTIPAFKVNSPSTYTNSKYGWSVTLTNDWINYGAYIDKGNNEDGDILGSVVFYHKETYNKYKQGYGYVFSIYATPIGSQIDNRTNGCNPNLGNTFLGTNDKYAFYWDKPTDFRLNQNDSDFDRIHQEYQKLTSQRDNVLNTFTLAN